MNNPPPVDFTLYRDEVPTRANRDTIRTRLTADVEAFIANGGKIQEVAGFEKVLSVWGDDNAA